MARVGLDSENLISFLVFRNKIDYTIDNNEKKPSKTTDNKEIKSLGYSTYVSLKDGIQELIKASKLVKMVSPYHNVVK